jgi:hypothetical protein
MSEFNFSRLSNCIEDYPFFYNPGTGYVTGEELREIKERHDEKAKMKWLYFFPVDKEAVGMQQKQNIVYREGRIFWAEWNLEKERKTFIIQSAVIGIFSIIVVFIWLPLVVVTLGILGFLGIKYLLSKSRWEKQIAKMKREISILKDEIEQLLKQVESFQDAGKIEQMLKEEVKNLELKSISDVVSEEIDNETKLDNYIKSQRTDKYFGVRSLLIDGWGIMQPFYVRGAGGDLEKTGLHRILEDLSKKSLAVALDTQLNPIFRVYYFQFIFLLERNINVASFFYDFIKKQKYGTKLETFQYPHITNFSIRETEMDDSQIENLGQLMRTMVDNSEIMFLKKEFQSFSLTVASGAHFKCVLVDEVVRNGLNKWFEAIDAKREIMKLDPNDPELKERFSYIISEGNKKVKKVNMEKLNEYIEKKKKDVKEKIKLYESIKDDYENVSKAREVLKEVKSGVERFTR